MTQKHYLLVVSPGPLMILRVPWPMPRWNEILRAATGVMRSHGLRQKDIHALEGLVAYPADRDEKDQALADRVEDAYEGAVDKVPRFWLYDWRRGAFTLSRSPTEIS